VELVGPAQELDPAHLGQPLAGQDQGGPVAGLGQPSQHGQGGRRARLGHHLVVGPEPSPQGVGQLLPLLAVADDHDQRRLGHAHLPPGARLPEEPGR
jgi:hypothetical protein